MTKILLSGCCGAMGRVVAAAAAQRNDCTVVAGYDRSEATALGFPVYSDLSAVVEAFDVIVDFSNPKTLEDLLNYAAAYKKPLVIATTGFSEEQTDRIELASHSTPIFFCANMSLGVSLMRELAITAARVLGDRFDVEIIEKHHHKKVDAPSGTALLLANAVAQVLPYSPHYTYDRHSSRTKRAPDEIGIHSVRGGTLVGEHEILFAGQDELLTITHTAYSKGIFAQGALTAATFLQGRDAGLYEMSDLTANKD